MKTPAPPLYSPRARGIGTGGACAWIALLVPKFAKARRRAPAWPMFEPGWPKHSAMTGGCSMAFPAVVAGSPRSRFRATTDARDHGGRSEEHTSELQSLMRSSYAVFCLKKKKQARPKNLYGNP